MRGQRHSAAIKTKQKVQSILMISDTIPCVQDSESNAAEDRSHLPLGLWLEGHA